MRKTSSSCAGTRPSTRFGPRSSAARGWSTRSSSTRSTPLSTSTTRRSHWPTSTSRCPTASWTAASSSPVPRPDPATAAPLQLRRQLRRRERRGAKGRGSRRVPTPRGMVGSTHARRRDGCPRFTGGDGETRLTNPSTLFTHRHGGDSLLLWGKSRGSGNLCYAPLR